MLYAIPGIGPSKPNFAECIQRLTNGGFTREQSLLALILSNQKLEHAIRFLRDPENEHLLVLWSYQGLAAQVKLKGLQS